MVQFMFHGQPYVLQSLATATISMLTVDIDRYDTFGGLTLIGAAQGHTIALNASLTSDLVVPGRTALDMPAPTGNLRTISLSNWIKAKLQGERIRAIVRQVFADRTDDDLSTTTNEAKIYMRQASRFQGVVDIQGWTVSRPNGGENTVAFQGRILETAHLGFWRDDADDDDLVREKLYGENKPIEGSIAGSSLTAQLAQIDGTKGTITLTFDFGVPKGGNEKYTLYNADKTSVASGLGTTRVAVEDGDRTHTITLAGNLVSGTSYTLQIGELVDSDDPTFKFGGGDFQFTAD